MKIIKISQYFIVLIFMISFPAWAAPNVLLGDKLLFENDKGYYNDHNEYTVPVSRNIKEALSLTDDWDLFFVFKDSNELTQFEMRTNFYNLLEKIKSVEMVYYDEGKVKSMQLSTMVDELISANGSESYQTVCGDQMSRGWFDKESQEVGIFISSSSSDDDVYFDGDVTGAAAATTSKNCPWSFIGEDKCPDATCLQQVGHGSQKWWIKSTCSRDHIGGLCLCDPAKIDFSH